MGAYKLNSKVTDQLVRESINLGHSYLEKATILRRQSNESMNMADKARFISDPDLSKAAVIYNRNQAANYALDSKKSLDLAFQNLDRAKSRKYTPTEKVEMLASMVSRRR